MNEQILKPKVREVLKLLENKTFIITGSLALKLLLGSLDRTPGDLDIISNDPFVIKILRKHCTEDFTGVLEIANHSIFKFGSLEVDVFRYPTLKGVPYITKTVEGFNLKITPTEFVLLKKLETMNSLSERKTVKDVTDYLKSKL